MRFTKLLFFLLVISTTFIVKAQDVKVGRDATVRQTGGAFYDYSDPDKINISVSALGYVKFPGKDLVPEGTNVLDLLTFAGGPPLMLYLSRLPFFRYAAVILPHFQHPKMQKTVHLFLKRATVSWNSIIIHFYGMIM
ncbi:MAG: hypothetical protein IPG53_13505 [Ignavibacteriales bacterium]|nr:hypothetical protein [Ignavibacteriales bacterium]